MKKLSWFLLPLGALVISGCSPTEASPPSASNNTVVMRDNVFDRDVYVVDTGTFVTFVNEGRNTHNAVDRDGSWSTEDTFGALAMNAGDSTQIAFDQPGEYLFVCTFHSANGTGMVATLIVQGPGATEPPAVAAAETPIEPAAAEEATTRNVPTDYPTIQSAVDAANPGDLVLIAAGTYREEVAVTTERLVIRGADRNNTIIDGEGVRSNGLLITADGVAVENLTVINAVGNGVFWTGVEGFRGSYLTTIYAGNYGIYAFDSSDGLIEYSMGSGAPDSGFYVGQCDPCNTIVTNVVAEYNGMGYSGTNASVEMYLIDSIWRHNGAGIVPNSLDGEKYAPFHDVTIIGNLIHDNSRTDVPFKNATWPSFGNGIIMAGGNTSLVERNRIVNHLGNGVVISPNLDQQFWFSGGNIVRDNIIEGSGRADLALAGLADGENCFENNEHTTSLPVGLETFQSCEGLRMPVLYELMGTLEPLGRVAQNGTGSRPNAPVGSTPWPEPQDQMPGGATAPVRPAVNVFASYPLDLAALTVPDLPAGVTITQQKGITVFGLSLAMGVWSIFFGLWAYLMPFMLMAALLAIGLWDLVRDNDRSRSSTIMWILIQLLIPFLGVFAYFLVGSNTLPKWSRYTIVFAGFGSYLILLIVGVVVGGIV